MGFPASATSCLRQEAPNTLRLPWQETGAAPLPRDSGQTLVTREGGGVRSGLGIGGRGRTESVSRHVVSLLSLKVTHGSGLKINRKCVCEVSGRQFPRVWDFYFCHFIGKTSSSASLTCPSQADFTLCVIISGPLSWRLATDKCPYFPAGWDGCCGWTHSGQLLLLYCVSVFQSQMAGPGENKPI